VGLIPARIEGIQDKFEALLDGYPYLANSLEAIEESASEAMRIVRDSLFHIRPVQLTAVRIVDCVEQAITSADIPFSLFVEYSGLEKLPPVTADRERLVLIFVNLLENAADAMNGHGHIWFSGQDLKDRVEIMVADSGPGIPPDLHERIFEQAFSGQSERPGKLGFGLWWVKTLMVRMGGSIAVKSDGKPGTTFILRFPRGRS